MNHSVFTSPVRNILVENAGHSICIINESLCMCNICGDLPRSDHLHTNGISSLDNHILEKLILHHLNLKM